MQVIQNYEISSVGINSLETLSIAAAKIAEEEAARTRTATEQLKNCEVSSASDHREANKSNRCRSPDTLKQDKRSIPQEACMDTLPRRTRTAFTPFQVCALEREYNNDLYLSKSKRTELARQLNLQETTIKVWFQNRRMKDKRRRVSIPWSYGLPPPQPMALTVVSNTPGFVSPPCSCCPLPVPAYPTPYYNNYPALPLQHAASHYPVYPPATASFLLPTEIRIPQASSCSPTSASEAYSEDTSSASSSSPQVVSTTTTTPSPEGQILQNSNIGPCMCYTCVGEQVPTTNAAARLSELKTNSALQMKPRTALFRPYDMDD